MKKIDYSIQAPSLISGVRVSVIIPVYNGANYVQVLLNQLENALDANDEIIFIDNNSTDESLIIIKKASETTKVPITLLTEIKQGAGAARNKGLQNAKGKYIAFIDVDDEISLNRFSIQVEFLENNPEFEIVFGKTVRVDNNNTPLAPYLVDSNEVDSFNLAEKIVKHFGSAPSICSFMYKRSFLSLINIQFPEELIFGQDLFFLVASLFKANKVYFENQTMYYYKRRDTSRTNLTKQKNNSNYNYYVMYVYYKKNVELFGINDPKKLLKIYTSICMSTIGNYRDYIYSKKESISKKNELFLTFLADEFKIKLNFLNKVICYIYYINKNKITKRLFYSFVFEWIMRKQSQMN